MVTEQDLREAFATRSLVRGGEQYFDRENAVAFMAACAENDLAPVGLEGFDVRGATVSPRLDQIADFSNLTAPSWTELKEKAVAAARAFLNQVEGSVTHFAVTLLSRSEWS